MIAWALVGAIAGAVAGSFLATLVIRWPQDRDVGGRSACDACGARLRWFELVPLLSFAVQRGRCRGCGATIDARHLAVEVGCVFIGAVALAAYPGVEGAFGALFGWLLIALAALDIEHFWLPDRLTAALAVAGLAGMAFGVPPAWQDRVMGGLAGFGSLALIAFAYRKLRGREGMGAGDPKLFGAIGLWTGWAALPFVLLLASAAGLAAALLMRLRGAEVSASTRLPLGALLAVAAFPVWLVSR